MTFQRIVLGRIFWSEQGKCNRNLKKCIARSSINCIISCIQLGDDVKASEIGEACKTLGKRGEKETDIYLKSMKARYIDLAVVGRTVLRVYST